MALLNVYLASVPKHILCIKASTIFCIGYYFICMKQKNNTDFGNRLASLRTAKGFTQREFAQCVGVSQRMIAYYEKHAKRPPLEKLEAIAKALGITIDDLLGVAPIKKMRGAPKDAYLTRKLQQVQKLSKSDQKIVVNMIDALATKTDITQET